MRGGLCCCYFCWRISSCGSESYCVDCLGQSYQQNDYLDTKKNQSQIEVDNGNIRYKQ